MKKLFLIICIFFFSASCTNAQTVKSYGIKIGGLIYTQETINRGSNTLYEPGSGGLGADVALFIDCNCYNRLKLRGELHLSDKGTKISEPGITEFFGSSSGPFLLSNRYRYLTLDVLAKFNTSEKETGLYFTTGISTGFMIQNYYTGFGDYHKLPNYKPELGGVFGMGVTFSSGFLIDLQYNPSFTNKYGYKANDYDVSFWNSSLVLSLGFCKSVKK